MPTKGRAIYTPKFEPLYPAGTMFQKRHYDAVANVLRGQALHAAAWDGPKSPIVGGPQEHARRGIVRGLASLFKADNPRFDPFSFYIACGCGRDSYEP